MTPCYFTRTPNGIASTELPISPWNAQALNGVAVGGLLAALLEEMAPATETPLYWTRLTIDLLGAVPTGELEPRFTMLRGGQQMQLCQVELIANGRAAARVQGLRVRETDTPVSELPVGYDGPEGIPEGPPQALGVLRHTNHRQIAGRDRREGPGVLWLRFGAEVIGGTPVTPLVRAAMAADYPAGRGNMIGADPYSWPNLDISLFLMREPVGEWLLVEAMTESAGRGSAIASGRLADRQGTFARTHQVVFVERTEREPDHVTL